MVQLINNSQKSDKVYSKFVTEIVNHSTGIKTYVPKLFHNISITFKEGISTLKVDNNAPLTFEGETYSLTYPELNTQTIIINPINIDSVIYITYQTSL